MNDNKRPRSGENVQEENRTAGSGVENRAMRRILENVV
jgi:hypothetical protein